MLNKPIKSENQRSLDEAFHALHAALGRLAKQQCAANDVNAVWFTVNQQHALDRMRRTLERTSKQGF